MKKITLLMLIVLMTFTAQSQNRILSSTVEQFSQEVWSPSYGFNYEYDANNNLVVETYLQMSNASVVVGGRDINTYNASNRIIQSIYQNFNEQTNQLVNDERSIYAYTNGRLSSIESQEWINLSWVNSYKIVVNYNTNNLPTTIFFYDWQNSQWVNDELTIYDYNANNKVSATTDQEWTNSQWVNSRKTLYVYNANNKLITERGAKWDVFNNVWNETGANRTDYVLDATGNILSRTESGNYDYKAEYTYATASLMSNFVHPFKDKTGLDYAFSDFPYVNKLLTERGFRLNTMTNNFELSSRTTYNYNSAIVLNTASFDTAKATISVYPNPAQDVLFIKNVNNIVIDKVTITDLSGKKILEQNGNKTSINIESIAAGMYVLEVISGESKMVEKFVKN